MNSLLKLQLKLQLYTRSCVISDTNHEAYHICINQIQEFEKNKEYKKYNIYRKGFGSNSDNEEQLHIEKAIKSNFVNINCTSKCDCRFSQNLHMYRKLIMKILFSTITVVVSV